MQIGICGFLFLIFITLKLTGVLTWSWTWIVSPLWIPLAAVLVTVGVVFLAKLFCGHRKPRRIR